LQVCAHITIGIGLLSGAAGLCFAQGAIACAPIGLLWCDLLTNRNYSRRRACDSKRSQRLSMLEDDWLSCPPKLFADGAIPEVVTA
jgi:hypothetical protein